jgi:hypothetical protein
MAGWREYRKAMKLKTPGAVPGVFFSVKPMYQVSVCIEPKPMRHRSAGV